MNFSFSHLEIMFLQALVLIVVSCVFVPAFKRLGLGGILGFLVSGVIVNLVFSGQFAEHPEELLHFSEFGVVLFLFVIGLELNPSSLWKMRGDIFGLGLLQVIGCGLVLGGVSYGLGYGASAAIIIGLGMALSSTAIVMSQLDENNERGSVHGRKTFSILLFQDLAIVPLLLLVTVLSPNAGDVGTQQSLINIGVAIAAIGILILIGKYLLDPLFKLLAKTRTQEIMTASALGVVIFAAMLMDAVGMSYAMGSFLAGVMLAESAYRHEIEANIEPFRGLFLGLFFIAVGLSLDLTIVADNWHIILIAAPAVMHLKAVTVYSIARLLKNTHNVSIKTALGLSQLGEFGFVLFGAAAIAGIFNSELSSILVATVSVSMALSPLADKLVPLFLSKSMEEVIDEDFSDISGHVLIIGFGRFGQIISQPLFSKGFDVTILDNDTQRVKDAGSFGFRVHFGDGTRRDILKAAGIQSFEAVIVCTDKKETTNSIVDLVKSVNPQTKIFARSYDRVHSLELYDKQVDYSVRETFESALVLGKRTLIGLGVSESLADEHIKDIRLRDKERLIEQAKGDLRAGMDKIHRRAVKPEPIVTENS
ncbi:cation:proton antiporter domain-containing protein [Kangiella shandongensis]|uniref:cation:proton antiporter domain-containing protein n=1 Tax=Kangiella shandongensis TaxID=2763258 RepID=UPI001CBF828C|nr:cation:proton antiporter [Kangiella shandongensis]